nr:hypothetical protein [Streptomyces boncukensis]
MAQLVPLVLLSLFWRRMTAAGGVAGLCTGLAVVLLLWATDNDPYHGVNGGLPALAANLAVAAAVTYGRPQRPGGAPGTGAASRTKESV